MGHTIVENFLWKLQNKSKRVPPVDKLIAAWNAMLLVGTLLNWSCWVS